LIITLLVNDALRLLEKPEEWRRPSFYYSESQWRVDAQRRIEGVAGIHDLEGRLIEAIERNEIDE
jgi:hypothetical protein